MLGEMKEVDGSEHSGAVVKKAAYVGGFSDLSSRNLFNLKKEKKRPRLVLSDSESSDELADSVRHRIHKFIENEDLQNEKRFSNEDLQKLMLYKRNTDQRESGSGSIKTIVDNKKDLYSENKSAMLGAKSSKKAMVDDSFDSPLSVSNSNENEEDFDGSVRLQGTNGVLKVTVNKHKRKLVKKDGTINTRTKNVNIVKRKESKIKAATATCTEKQLLREKIKKMLLDAGWTIDYRPRRNRDYLDSVYISPSGSGYWSITKAYEALRKEEKESSKASEEFTPLPNEILKKLTRQTRKKIEREIEKNRKDEGNISRKSRKDRHRLSESRFKEAIKETGDNSAMEKSIVRINSHRKSGEIGRLSLLVRGYDTCLNSEDDEFVSYSGKRTLIFWLIESGMVCVGEKVEYMNLRKTRVMQHGWITKDGIHCDCCSKIVTILRFELHAGSKLGQPFENIFIESGQSLIQLQIDAWNKQQESERQGFHVVDDGDDPNDDTCGLCGDGGDLICCDGCPSTFHLTCLDMKMLPQGDWHCSNCACKHCERVGGYHTKASGRTETSLLTCQPCEKKYHKSCNREMDDKRINSNDLNFSFCGQKCRELYSRLQKLLWIRHELDSGFSWSLIRRSDPLPDVSSVNFSQRVECNSKLAIALSLMDECFLPIVDRRSGIPLIHNVVYNCGSNFSRLNYSGFYTAILERGDEMICAASIRIHGTQLAEMPFIGTRHLYRRQGMCRRLLNAIESALSSLEVEKLVIPAIEEHMHTWTNAFGFRPLVKSEKQEMRSVNMLVFPGINMLQKPLMKQETEVVAAEEEYNANVLMDVVYDSGSKVETIDQPQNGIGITDADTLQPHYTLSTILSYKPQLQITPMDSDSVAVENGNVIDLLSHQVSDILLEPLTVSAYVAKQNDVHDVTNRNV